MVVRRFTKRSSTGCCPPWLKASANLAVGIALGIAHGTLLEQPSLTLAQRQVQGFLASRLLPRVYAEELRRLAEVVTESGPSGGK